jgi:phosphate transport system protein
MIDVLQRNTSIEISRDQLSQMAELVKRALDRSLKALFTPDILLAQEVIGADKAINSYEIDVDNTTFSMLTISNIPSETLRSIVSIQKVNAMLERIGDHAVNIAESAISIAIEEQEKNLFSLPEMAGLCKTVLSDSLASFFNKDVNLAQDVLTRDDKIDALNVAIIGEVKVKVLASELAFETGLDIIRVSKNLERIADLSSILQRRRVSRCWGGLSNTIMTELQLCYLKTNSAIITAKHL